MNRLILSILLLISCQINAQVTLNQAIEIGIADSYQGRNIVIRRDILNHQIASFQSSLGWQMDFDGQIPAYAKSNLSTVQNDGNIAFQSVNYNNSSLGLRLSKSIWQTGGQFEITSGLQRFDNFQSKNHTYNGIPIRLTFRQNLLAYNPFKWEQKNYQLKKEINHRQTKVDQSIIKIDITNAFFDVLSAQNEIESNKSNVKLTQNLMNIAKAKDSLGLISQKQFLQLQLQLKTAQSQLNIAYSYLQTAKLNLSSLLSNRKELSDTFEIPIPTTEPIDLNAVTDLAQANRPEWLELRRRIQEKVQVVKAQSKQYGPSIGLHASLGLIRSDATISPIYNDAQQDQSISLSFSVPIFDSRLKRNKVLIAKAELEQQKNDSQRAVLSLENDITQTAMEFQACQERLAYAEEIKNIAIKNLTITTKTFKLGLINIAELNLAIQEKNRAFRHFISEIRRYWLLRFKLML